jgi:hypothetical protein
LDRERTNDSPQDICESVDLFTSIEAAEAYSNQSTSTLIIEAHSQQNSGGLAGMVGTTGATRRDCNTSSIEG